MLLFLIALSQVTALLTIAIVKVVDLYCMKGDLSFSLKATTITIVVVGRARFISTAKKKRSNEQTNTKN